MQKKAFFLLKTIKYYKKIYFIKKADRKKAADA